MTAVITGLLCLSLALVIQHLMLAKRKRSLAAAEQAFAFHAIRDELQVLALEGKVVQDSYTYFVIMSTANLAIRNAGVFRIRDLVRVAQQVDKHVSGARWARFEDDVQRQPEEVRVLAGKSFMTLTQMLVANDLLVKLGWKCAVMAATTLEVCRPVLKRLVAGLDEVARHAIPTKALAVEFARRYEKIAGSLAPAA